MSSWKLENYAFIHTNGLPTYYFIGHRLLQDTNLLEPFTRNGDAYIQNCIGLTFTINNIEENSSHHLYFVWECSTKQHYLPNT
jgi:hypothetical protein